MPEQNVDAFILFNEQESTVEEIVNQLGSQGVSTYFWRRDVPLGASWEELEGQRLKEAHVVLVFLGKAGWGPSHLKITQKAQGLEKRIIPILIGDPPEKAFFEAGSLFRVHRYLDLRKVDASSLGRLVDSIRQREPSALIDRIVNVLVDGNEEQRSDVLLQIRTSTLINRSVLAARLRTEIQDRFGPQVESKFGAATRDPKKISSIRSWMLSALIWADAEGLESHKLILKHVRFSEEPDRNVRFWALSGVYGVKASYLHEALGLAQEDPAPEVAALVSAILSPASIVIHERFRRDLFSPDFETVWPILRVLRVVPIPSLAADVCALIDRSASGTALAYDSLYALSNPVMAREAAKILPVRKVVERVIGESRSADRNSIRNFTGLLTTFDGVDALLAETERDPVIGDIARSLRRYLRDLRPLDSSDEVLLAGYASETIDIHYDPLGIQEDVQTLTAVMLAKDAPPPLAIGLFGDWGSGKSYFMKSMRAAADDLAGRAGGSQDSRFCSNIVPIEFNAWHYVDTNLWASLVSSILEKLAAYVTPQRPTEEQQGELLSELGSAKAATGEAESEKERVKKLIEDGQRKLQRLEVERQQKEIKLLDLRIPDLHKLLSTQEKAVLNDSLEKIGIPAALNSVADLANVVSEVYTVRGRVAALFGALLNVRSRTIVLALIAVVLLIPAIGYLVNRYLPLETWIVSVSTLIAQAIGVAFCAMAPLRKALKVMITSVDRLETAKKRVDALMAERRQAPTEEEIKLQNEIAGLKAQEQEAISRLSAATARVRELEERLIALKEGRSLARFLAERTRSEDYRRHLGLISTIRQDLESLGERLSTARSESSDKLRPVDRIILFIDDLDRCPADKVMDVLQAVHLLLAYPLFVVVVGVDPRWLLHSLGTTYSAFRNEDRYLGTDPDLWQTTPQNYLEKIFQIPFNLARMTDEGYGNLIQNLLSSEVKADRQGAKGPQVSAIPQEEDHVAPASLAPSTPSQTAEAGDASKLPRDNTDVPAEQFMIQEESLTIKTWEVEFAARLFALIPTPRAAKRFSNTYRILKARVRRERLTQFEGTEHVPGEFQVPMLLLAILIGFPNESAALFPKLHGYAASGLNATESLRRLEALGLQSDAFKRLEEKMRPILDDGGFPQAREIYLEWLPRVSRFSFELGRILSP